MRTKTKRLLYWCWYPFGILMFILFTAWVLIGLMFQPFVGINSYLHNWHSDRNLKEEISTANPFSF